jgi:hypothetical protein
MHERVNYGRHLGIAVFVKDATADEAVHEAAVATIARACWDRRVSARTRGGQK